MPLNLTQLKESIGVRLLFLLALTSAFLGVYITIYDLFGGRKNGLRLNFERKKFPDRNLTSHVPLDDIFDENFLEKNQIQFFKPDAMDNNTVQTRVERKNLFESQLNQLFNKSEIPSNEFKQKLMTIFIYKNKQPIEKNKTRNVEIK